MLSGKKTTQFKELVTLEASHTEGGRAEAVKSEGAKGGIPESGRGSRQEKLGPFGVPGVMLCFPPQGRTKEPSPLQASPQPRWSQDEGVRAHDPVPGVLGSGQALCTPASPRQHDHGERQDQHHGKLPLCPAAPGASEASRTQRAGISGQNTAGPSEASCPLLLRETPCKQLSTVNEGQAWVARGSNQSDFV